MIKSENIGNCKHCDWWIGTDSYDKRCECPKLRSNDLDGLTTVKEQVEIWTGPNFGCVHYR